MQTHTTPKTKKQDPARGTGPEYVTVGELARKLRITPRTAMNIIRRNQIPHARFGNRIRIPARAVHDFLATVVKTPSPPAAGG